MSGFLFDRPSMLEGAARLLDFVGALNTYNTRYDSADFSLARDWAAVSDDVHTGAALATQSVGQEG